MTQFNNRSANAVDAGLSSHIRQFDFSLLFEDTFLTILPAAAFVIAAATRAVWLINSPKKVVSSSGRSSKLILLSAFATVQLTVLLTRVTATQDPARTAVAAAALDFIAACVLFLLSVFEHSRSVTPSTTICLYLLFTLFFDAARLRTFYLLPGPGARSVANLLSVAIAAKGAVLVSEGVEKRNILLHPFNELPPESTAGVYSRSLFWWLVPLLRIGFGGTITTNVLFDLDDGLASTNLRRQFQREWAKIRTPSKRSLLWLALRQTKWRLFGAALPRILLSGVRFSQPYLMQDTLSFVNDRSKSNAVGWGLVGAYFLVYFAQAVLTAAYQHGLYRVGTQLRGGLSTLLYQKTLDLSISADESNSVLTLMSADIQRIFDAAPQVHDSWLSIIEVGVAMYLLYNRLGAACYGSAVVYFSLMFAASITTRYMGRFQKFWLEAVEKRISFTSDVLQSIRNIKLLGLSSVVEKKTQDLRLDEIKACKKYRRVNVVTILLQNGAPVFAPFATFSVYFFQARAAGKPLEVSQAFSVLTILRLMESPLNVLVYSAPLLAGAISCFGRLQHYLEARPRNDNRLTTRASSDSWNIDDSGIEMQRPASSSDVVNLKNCSFGWDHGMVVNDVDLAIRPGTINIIVGPIGSGKSTLIMGVLGETALSRGFVYLRDQKIGFAGQEPWIPNGTVSSVIKGIAGDHHSDPWYEEIVECCALTEDIENFSAGDQTIIGTKGLSLSGGQKQRLALARATYAKPSVIILDDVFSGLDNDTEEHIFRKLFARDGPVRRNHITVLMATHAVHRLPIADFIVSLSEDGRITEQGTFTQLHMARGYVNSLKIEAREESTPAEQRQNTRGMKSSSTGSDTDEQEDLLRRKGEWATYAHYFRSAGVVSTTLSVVWALLWMVSGQMPGILVRIFANESGVSTTSPKATAFILAFGISCAISVVTCLLLAWQIFLEMQPRSGSLLHHNLLRTVLNAPLSFFTRTDAGSILNRFSQDINLTDTELLYSYADALLSAVSVLMGLLLMAISGAGYFAAVIPFTIGALYAIQKYYLMTSRQMRILDLEEKAPLYTLFSETAAGLATVRAFGWSQQLAERNLTLLDRSQRPMYLMTCLQRWLSVVLDTLIAVLVAILMVVVVLCRDTIAPATIGLGLLSVVSLSSALNQLIRNWTNLETSVGAVSRLRDFSRTTVSEHKSIENRDISDWPVNGALTFDSFAASYSELSDLVLQDVKLNIRQGEKIGVCGRSGSGKSSMLASLFHLLEFRHGRLEIDGVNVSEIPRETLRSRLNVIPQEPWWITTESVRFNMDPWSSTKASDQECITALQRCQIWSVIQAKGGLQATMKGDFLSHGQRQLFCLARAIVRKSKIVVLDEVSANVDVKTDELMQKIIREEFAGCTIISVAHRLNTIADFDRIVVLRSGKVIELGTPAGLLSGREGHGAFKELYELR